MIRVMMVLAWALVFCTGQLALSEESEADNCVVLISVDGLANFYLDDPHARMPTIRSLIKDGAWASQGMEASFPSVTWPNHTTMVTGVSPAKHGVFSNEYLLRSSAERVPLCPDPLLDKDEIVRVPTVYDAAAEAGLKTAGILWPATRNAKNLHWTVPDMLGDDAWAKYGSPFWLAELREAGIPVDRHGAWTGQASDGGQRDWLYTQMFTHLFQHHRPNLVLIHLVKVDQVQHKYGPRSPEAYWSLSHADDRVRDIVETVRNSDRVDHTTIIVVSDHGFFSVNRWIRPNRLLSDFKLPNGQPAVRCITQGGACMLYILDDERKDELRKYVLERFPGVEGIEAVIGPDQFGRIGQLTPEEDPRCPDFWLAASDGYAFSESANEGLDVVGPGNPAGVHGYMTEHPDMRAMFVISGAKARKGVDLGKVSNMDIAPTIAKLLEIHFPNTEGNVLDKALVPHP